MEGFLMETHFHTDEISPCGKVPVARGLELYAKAGFDAVIMTDHLRQDVRRNLGEAWRTAYFDVYRRGVEIGRRLGLLVFPGMELCFPGTEEDYLLYGIDEHFLERHPDLMELGLERLYALCQAEGILLVQAHPKRAYIRRVSPEYLEGMEALNTNPRQDSHNDEAQALARQYGLLETAGSDFHNEEDLAVGMLMTRPITSSMDFAQAVREHACRGVWLEGQEHALEGRLWLGQRDPND